LDLGNRPATAAIAAAMIAMRAGGTIPSDAHQGENDFD
jgi:hypothetical protein